MKWKQVTPRRKRVQPNGKDYRKWKPDVAADCHRRCVYCAIPESLSGHSIRVFTIDHFRPENKFKPLRLRIWNLYLCCIVCNTYKNDDWPGEVINVFEDAGYIDPSHSDLSLHFYSGENGVIYSDSVAGRYMIFKLNLNRGQLVAHRRLEMFHEWRRGLNERIDRLTAGPTDVKTWQEIASIYRDLLDLDDKFKNARLSVEDFQRGPVTQSSEHSSHV